MSKNSLISFRDVSFSYNKKNKIYTGLSFDIKKNSTTSFVGKSGCGKSTILKMIINLLKTNSGNIYYNLENEVMTNKNINMKFLKKNIGYVSQKNCFYNELTCFENLNYFCELFEVSNKTNKINEILDIVSLYNSKNKLAKNLSGGEQRRLEFAISILNFPKLLILDEPFVGLDVLSINSILKLIEKIKKFNTTIIIISHRLEILEDICDEVHILKNKTIFKTLKKINGRLNLKQHFLEVFGK